MAKIPSDVLSLLQRYVEKYPVPQGEVNTPEAVAAIEEQCRQWAIRWAQQAAFSFPGQGYGTKRADPGRPISKDGFAQQQGNRLIVWDLVTGAGTGHGQFVGDKSESIDITGQVFVEVIPKDSLGNGHTPIDPPTDFHWGEEQWLAIAAAVGRIELSLGTVKNGQAISTETTVPQQLLTRTNWAFSKLDRILTKLGLNP